MIIIINLFYRHMRQNAASKDHHNIVFKGLLLN